MTENNINWVDELQKELDKKREMNTYSVEREEKERCERREYLRRYFDALFPHFDSNVEKICIRTIKRKDNKPMNHFFNNIEDIVKFIIPLDKKNDKYYLDMYVCLSTIKVDSKTTKEKDLYRRGTLIFDFDILKEKEDKEIIKKREYLKSRGKEDKDIIDIIRKEIIHERFNKLGLFYHSVTNSGNGLHVYVFIKDTRCIKDVENLNMMLCDKLKSDKKACLSTQIIRIPFTKNNKDINDRKNAVGLWLDEDIQRKSAIKLIRRFCENRPNYNYDNKNIKGVMFDYLPLCMKDELENGTKEGDRHKQLIKFVKCFRNMNIPVDDIKLILEDWAIKSDNYNEDEDLPYQIENIYKTIKSDKIIPKCNTCKYKTNCSHYNTLEVKETADNDNDNPNTHIDYPTGDILVLDSNYLKNSIKGEELNMEGNEFFIMNVLYNHSKDGEWVKHKDLKEYITYKNKVRFNKDRIKTTTDKLKEKGYLDIKGNGRAKQYRLTPKALVLDDEIMVSYIATIQVIKNDLTPNALKLYYILRYKYHEMVKSKKNVLKNGYIQLNYYELSQLYYGHRNGKKEIGEMIENLVVEKLLERIPNKKKRGVCEIYYTYKLNM